MCTRHSCTTAAQSWRTVRPLIVWWTCEWWAVKAAQVCCCKCLLQRLQSLTCSPFKCNLYFHYRPRQSWSALMWIIWANVLPFGLPCKQTVSSTCNTHTHTNARKDAPSSRPHHNISSIRATFQMAMCLRHAPCVAAAQLHFRQQQK